MKTLIIYALFVLNFAAWGQSATSQSPNLTHEEVESYFDDLTGVPTIGVDNLESYGRRGGCVRSGCPVFVRISKGSQSLTLYVNGAFRASWPVSTGLYAGTKNWDGHPTGGIYDYWDSRKYPEGDYNGMGNMPYAIFYYRGFAVHGTPRGNWNKLGRPASHGCIRLHPHNARVLNRLVRKYGLRSTWFTIR